MLLYKIIICIFVLIYSPPIFASLSFSEIYPAPINGTDEWIEVYNNSSERIMLSNVYIQDASGKKIRLMSDRIEGNAFSLATSSGVLNNSDETLTLVAGEQTLESVSYGNGLDSSKSYTKCNGKWIITTAISKLASNDCTSIVESLTPTPVSLPTEIPLENQISPIPTSTVSLQSIFFSEVMVQPPSGQTEWIELYNSSPIEVTISNWYIDDIANGGSTPRQFSMTIPSHGYQTYDLPTGIFNNDEDEIRLLDSTGNLIAIYSYFHSSTNNTWGKKNDQFCLQVPSKGMENNPCISTLPETATKTTLSKQPTPSKTPKPTPTLKQIAAKNVSVKGESTKVIGQYKSSPYATISKSAAKPKDYIIYPASQRKTQASIISGILFLTICNSMCWSILLILNSTRKKNYWYSSF